jgi:radical SAM/Cys-rich protein
MAPATFCNTENPCQDPKTHLTFAETLLQKNLVLERDETKVLQINIGLVCDLKCTHCHLNAGPGRKEIMSLETMNQVIDFAFKHPFEILDITGGAPELNPHLETFIESLIPLKTTIILRSNLSALWKKGETLMNFLKEKKINIVTSFPSLNEIQAESVRGKGFFNKSIETLQKLNQLGYGHPNTGLKLDLVVNPSGAFLSPSQGSIEKRFRKTLQQKWNIHFNQLFSFSNVPLGRFRSWLKKTDNLENYMKKIRTAFNPCAVDGLMCKTLLSVSWDGYLFDCDFNQADRLHIGNQKTHITQLKELPAQGSKITVGDHCFTCTAGTGFT